MSRCLNDLDTKKNNNHEGELRHKYPDHNLLCIVGSWPHDIICFRLGWKCWIVKGGSDDEKHKEKEAGLHI